MLLLLLPVEPLLVLLVLPLLLLLLLPYPVLLLLLLRRSCAAMQCTWLTLG